MTGRPLARSQDLIVEELDDELLVYDERTNRGHCLSPEAARVWRRCDGKTPADGLSAQLDLDPDTVDRALDELESCDLLEAPPELALDDGSVGSTRRELTVKAVKVGGAVAAAPLIVSIAAPTAQAAQTVIPECEALFTCLGDCGQTGHGCQGTGCCCCQFKGAKCPEDGGTGFRCADGKLYGSDNNNKFCVPNTNTNPSQSQCNTNGGICDQAMVTMCNCLATDDPNTCGTNNDEPCVVLCQQQTLNAPKSTKSTTTPTTTTPTTTAPTTTTPTTTTPSTPPSTGGATTTTTP